MASVTAQIRVYSKWWFVPACYAVALALRLGIIRDRDRVINWLADVGFVVDD